MHKLNRSALLLGLVGVLFGAACDNPQGFVEPEKRTQSVVALRNATLNGMSQLVYRVNVLAGDQMIHPHLEGHWNYADNEKPVDVYVFHGNDYVESNPPTAQDSLPFWSSLQNSLVGQQRAMTMFLHPEPGEWVVVLYNAGPATTSGRATFSATVDLLFFK